MKIKIYNTTVDFAIANGTKVFDQDINSAYSAESHKMVYATTLSALNIPNNKTVAVVMTYPQSKAVIWGGYTMFFMSGVTPHVLGEADNSGESFEFATSTIPLSTQVFIASDNADVDGVAGDCQFNLKVYVVNE